MPAPVASANGKARIFIVDDHPIIRRGLQMLLNRELNFSVCGEADTSAAALEGILKLKPDVAIVDLVLGSGSGLELIKQVRAHGLNTRLLVFTMRGDAVHAERALRAGANAYISKEEGPEKVLEAIQLLLQGKNYVTPALAEMLVSRLAGGNPGKWTTAEALSDRELEILELIGRGLGSREIANALHVSIKTVESHREHIKTKLGLTRASELVNYAFNWLRDEQPGLGGSLLLAVLAAGDSWLCSYLRESAWPEEFIVNSPLQLLAGMLG
jgi:DNA-binding NarL/FixJ family response regulator